MFSGFGESYSSVFANFADSNRSPLPYPELNENSNVVRFATSVGTNCQLTKEYRTFFQSRYYVTGTKAKLILLLVTLDTGGLRTSIVEFRDQNKELAVHVDVLNEQIKISSLDDRACQVLTGQLEKNFEVDLEANIAAVSKLRSMCPIIRHSLTKEQSALARFLDYTIEIRRDEYNSWTRLVGRKIKTACKEALRTGGIAMDMLDGVELIGPPSCIDRIKADFNLGLDAPCWMTSYIDEDEIEETLEATIYKDPSPEDLHPQTPDLSTPPLGSLELTAKDEELRKGSGQSGSDGTTEKEQDGAVQVVRGRAGKTVFLEDLGVYLNVSKNPPAAASNEAQLALLNFEEAGTERQRNLKKLKTNRGESSSAGVGTKSEVQGESEKGRKRSHVESTRAVRPIDLPLDYRYSELERYAKVEEIARTNLSVVYKAFRKTDNVEVIIKRAVHKRDYTSRFRHEAAMHQRFCEQCEMVVKVIECFEEMEEFYMVMEKMEMDVCKYIDLNFAIREDERKSLIRNALKALKFLHDKNYVHGDVKPENFLLNPPTTIRLTDFGRTEIKGHGREDAVYYARAYRPPEAFTTPPTLDPASDIWAVGVMHMDLVMNSWDWLSPQTDMEQMHNIDHKLVADKHHNIQGIKQLKEYERDFLKCIFKKDYTERPTVGDLLRHPWIK